jgi:uncharacterized membrane protein
MIWSQKPISPIARLSRTLMALIVYDFFSDTWRFQDKFIRASVAAFFLPRMHGWVLPGVVYPWRCLCHKRSINSETL